MGSIAVYHLRQDVKHARDVTEALNAYGADARTYNISGLSGGIHGSGGSHIVAIQCESSDILVALEPRLGDVDSWLSRAIVWRLAAGRPPTPLPDTFFDPQQHGERWRRYLAERAWEKWNQEEWIVPMEAPTPAQVPHGLNYGVEIFGKTCKILERAPEASVIHFCYLERHLAPYAFDLDTISICKCVHEATTNELERFLNIGQQIKALDVAGRVQRFQQLINRLPGGTAASSVSGKDLTRIASQLSGAEQKETLECVVGAQQRLERLHNDLSESFDDLRKDYGDKLPSEWLRAVKETMICLRAAGERLALQPGCELWTEGSELYDLVCSSVNSLGLHADAALDTFCKDRKCKQTAPMRSAGG